MSDTNFLDEAFGRMFEEPQSGTVLALPPIAQALDASYALLFRTNKGRGVIEDASCCGVDSAYVDRLKDAARERLLPAWLNGLSPGSVEDRAAFGTDQEFARTPFYNHVIRPEGRFHCLIATPYVSDACRFHLVVGRPRTHDEFSSGDQRLLRLLLPHLGEILRLQGHLTQVQTFAYDLIDLFGDHDSPLMVVTRDGVLQFANGAARRLLAARQGLRIGPASQVMADTLEDSGRLRRAFRAAAAEAGGQAIALCGADGPTVHLTVKRLRNGDRASEPDAAQTRLLVHVEGSANADSQARAARIARQHGLTRREAELLTVVAEGATLQSAARQLGISYNTGRTHLRQIFGKVNLHRQSDLVRLCTTGRQPS